MMEAIRHRGPDDEGQYLRGPVALGSRRLSIIDLDSGRMPIANEDGTVRIVFNGEIYNFAFLRRQLIAKGHRFQTRSDTEVIVHLYEEYGEECLQHLRGMFAFAIWDERERKLFLARDHLGQKPLFYAFCAGRFYFASEIKSILAAGVVPREIDYQSLSQYLSLRFIPAPGTMLKGINKLAPGNFLTFQAGKIRCQSYWDVDFTSKTRRNEERIAEELQARLQETVAAHTIADVDVGAFLSGGLDSSTVVAMMARRQAEPIHTFAVGVAEQSFNELPYAKMVADRYGTRHHEACAEANLIANLPRMIWHLDEPSDPIAACMFYAARLAAQHVKVVLGGDGGDELFGGFDRYMGLGKVDLYSRVPALLREQVIGSMITRIPENFAYKSVTQKIRWVQQLAALREHGERYAEATFFFRFNTAQKEALFGEVLRPYLDGDTTAVILQHFHSGRAEDLVDKMIYTDMKTRLPEHSLMLTDRMTMAHGLELRSPLLDHQLVEFMATLPSHMKIRRGELKYILRRIAGDFLPREIVTREKQGFMFPIADWFRNELYPFVRDYLLHSTLVREGIFREDYLRRLLEEHRQKRFDHHVRLWMLLNVAIWQTMYIEGRSREAVEAEIRARIG